MYKKPKIIIKNDEKFYREAEGNFFVSVCEWV